MAFNINTINSELNATITDFAASYKTACETSRNNYMQNAPAGASIPPEGTIYGSVERDNFREECGEYKQRISSILKPVYDDLEAKATEPPTTEAVNAVTMLQARDNVTADEIGMLIKRYGDNPATRNTLVQIAEKHKIHDYRMHPVADEIAAVKDLEECLNRQLNATAILSNGFTAGRAAAIAAQINNTFRVDK